MPRIKSHNVQLEINGTPESISVKEAGRRGGYATLETQGVDFFKKIGKKGGQRTKELYGELLSQLGKNSGRPRRPTLDE
jgi:general stress protein YciG